LELPGLDASIFAARHRLPPVSDASAAHPFCLRFSEFCLPFSRRRKPVVSTTPGAQKMAASKTGSFAGTPLPTPTDRVSLEMQSKRRPLDIASPEKQMITRDKLKEYTWADGDIDGWSRSGRTSDITSEEWYCIDGFFSEITVIRRNLATDGFKEQHVNKVRSHFDSLLSG
jgi:hypothetical protein